MKKFFTAHSFTIVNLFVTQFAIAIIGFVMALATAQKSIALLNFSSVFAIVFYLVLIYMKVWEVGFADKVSVEAGKKKRNAYTGVLISLCANVINFLLAVPIMLGVNIQTDFFGNLGGASKTIALFLQGMYTGLISNVVGGEPLHMKWFIFFLLPIPAILTCWLAYYLGLRDIKLTTLFTKNKSDLSSTKEK